MIGERIPKEVARYIEYELDHFEQYKRELEFERERILEASVSPTAVLGTIASTNISNVTLNKSIKLVEGTAILALERRVNAVERMLLVVTHEHKDFFNEYFLKKNKNIINVCHSIHISRETFYRYKKEIIITVGMEMGVLQVA